MAAADDQVKGALDLLQASITMNEELFKLREYCAGKSMKIIVDGAYFPLCFMCYYKYRDLHGQVCLVKGFDNHDATCYKCREVIELF